MVRIALVTGANKGIGWHIVDQLLKRDGGLLVVLTSRDEERGKVALGELAAVHGQERLLYRQLDIDQPESVNSAAEWVKKEYGGIDLLINNAGIAWKGDAFTDEVASSTISCNYYGTLNMCQAFLPLLRDNGRIVNVSSTAGKIGRYSPELQAHFEDPNLGVPGVTALMERFKTGVREGTYDTDGWPKSTYGVSKAGVTALTIVLARDYEKGLLPADVKAKGLAICCCCPGYCDTDMTSHRGTRSAAEGADTPVWLALEAHPATIQGGFFQDRKVVSFV